MVRVPLSPHLGNPGLVTLGLAITNLSTSHLSTPLLFSLAGIWPQQVTAMLLAKPAVGLVSNSVYLFPCQLFSTWSAT